MKPECFSNIIFSNRRMKIADKFLELDLSNDDVIEQFFNQLNNQPVAFESIAEQASMEASEE